MAQKAELKGKINLDSSGFSAGLKKAKNSVKSFASSAVAQFVRVGAAFAGIGLIKGIVNLGLAAGETASKFQAVFGPATGEMSKKIIELRKTIPSTTAEMQNALATFAAMAKGFGLNTEAANMFSVEMVKISGDIASFHNLPIEEAFLKIRSAISGEFEPMKALGIVMNEATIKREALNLKIWDGVGAMSAAQKALAVQSILIRDLGDANGDAAATADSAANRVKFLRAELLETGTKIGTTALPAILQLTAGLAELLKLTGQFTNFMGSAAGQLIYGPTDETIEYIEKAAKLRSAEKQAVEELTAANKLYKQGMFEGTLWTKGLSEKLEENKRLIAERTEEILNGTEAEKKAAEEKTKANNDALRETSDLTAELTKQIETEKDPIRKKSMIDRLGAYADLVKAAGELFGIENTKIKTDEQKQKDEDEVRIAKSKLELLKAEISENQSLINEKQKQLALEEKVQSIMKSANVDRETAINLAKQLIAVGAGADKNQSGYTTPREQRAAEREARKREQLQRQSQRDERASEVGQSERDRTEEINKRMSQAEYGAAGSEMGMSGAKDAAIGGIEKESKSEETLNKSLEKLEDINKQLSKLDSALSGD